MKLLEILHYQFTLQKANSYNVYLKKFFFPVITVYCINFLLKYNYMKCTCS